MTKLLELEKQIAGLPQEEKLWLLERLAHHLRQGATPDRDPLVTQLEDMANDPEIQRELEATVGHERQRVE